MTAHRPDRIPSVVSRCSSGACPCTVGFPFPSVVSIARTSPPSIRSEDLPPYLHPGQSARFIRDGRPIGFLGELSPTLIERFAVPTTILAFEFCAADLTINADAPIAYAEPPQFPASKRDLSVSAPAELPEAEVREAILAEPEVETALLYDLYEGEQVGEGRKSFTYELAFRAMDRTLTDPEVDEIVARIESRLATLDVRLRT